MSLADFKLLPADFQLRFEIDAVVVLGARAIFESGSWGRPECGQGKSAGRGQILGTPDRIKLLLV